MRPFTWSARAALIVLTAMGVGVVAVPAEAATAGVASVAQTSVVTYTAAGATANNVVFTRSGRTITVDDVVPIRAGSGCAAIKGDTTRVLCTPKVDPRWVRVSLASGNDAVINKTNLPMSAQGGAGHDRITGGPANDLLDGNAGNDAIWGLGGADHIADPDGANALSGGDGNDTVIGGWGNDRLYGGNGDDELNGFEGNDVEDGGPGQDRFEQNLDPRNPDADAFVGGAGFDTVSYGSRSRPITADADATRGDDGAAGERDTIGASVERIIGGSGNDRLFGTPRADYLIGGPGKDTLSGGPADDYLYADDEAAGDRVDGGPGTGDVCLTDAPRLADIQAACEHTSIP